MKTNFIHHYPGVDSQGLLHEMLYVVGNVTDDIPFLVETSNTKELMTPFLLRKDGEIGCVKGVPVLARKLTERTPCMVATITPHFKSLAIPTIAINLDNEMYDRIVTYSPIIQELKASRADNKKRTIFLPYVAFAEDALLIHNEIRKGDMVSFLGEIKKTKIPIIDSSQYMLWVKDARFIRKAARNQLEGTSVQ